MDRIDPRRRSENMRRIRGRDTVPEMLVRRAIHARRLRFRLHRRDLPGTPDVVLARYTYRPNGDLWTVGENGAASGVGLLASYAYDGLGRRTSLQRGNGTTTSWGYADPSTGAPTPWLTRLAHDLAGTGADVVRSFGYDAAGGILTATGSNDAYVHTARESADIGYSANALNQYGQAGSATLGYDGRGNLTGSQASARVATYGYSADNLLTSSRITDYPAGGGTVVRDGSYEYDGLGRLFRLGATGTVLRYEGDQLIGEQDAQGAPVQRYIPGANGDEPLTWYEGSGAGERRWFYQDERGSVIAVADQNGAATRILSYDEYGVPGKNNGDVRYQYTGQLWLGELGGYHYKARTYSATLGRFLQSDPIGMAGGINLYAYAGSDPVNRTDPSGLEPDIVVTGVLPPPSPEPPKPYYNGSFPDGNGYPGGEHSTSMGSSYDRGERIRNGTAKDEPKKAKPARKSVPCNSLLTLEGNVLARYVSGTAVVGGGITGGYGRFTNLATGATGHFYTAGGAAGYEVTGGGSVTIYHSLNDLNGFAASVNLQLGPVTASFNFNKTGFTAVSLGAALPTGAGANVAASGTTLYGCSVPGR